MPLVTPTVRTAAVDGAGHLWISFVVPYTYVYDADGDKIRTVQFRGAGIIAPNSLFFGKNGRVLVTPGRSEFEPGGTEKVWTRQDQNTPRDKGFPSSPSSPSCRPRLPAHGTS